MGILALLVSFVMKCFTFAASVGAKVAIKVGTKAAKKGVDQAGGNKRLLFILNWVSNILGFISMAWLLLLALPILLKIMILALVLLLVLALVLVAATFLMGMQGDSDVGRVSDSAYQSSGVSGTYQSVEGFLAFTQEELDMYGSSLTEYEKNIYRYGMSIKSALEGYGELKYYEDIDFETSVRFMLGVPSTENGMTFNTGGEVNILTTAVNIPLNSSGFGLLGLCGKEYGCANHSKQYRLSMLSNEARANLTGKFPLPIEPKPTINFIPYASFYMLMHFNSKTETARRHIDKVIAVLEQWGIRENQDQHAGLILHIMSQAGYHGVAWKDAEQYANFWAALIHATSDVDSERSLSKWTVAYTLDGKNKFDESGMRKSFNGDNGCSNYVSSANPLDYKGVGGDNYEVQLNGVTLDVPVWTYLYQKYSNNEGFLDAVKFNYNKAKHCSGGGSNAQTMNFHYGVNSYWQGNRIIAMLREKMGVPAKTEVFVPNGDATPIGGEPTKVDNVAGSIGDAMYVYGGYAYKGLRIRHTDIKASSRGKPQGVIHSKNGIIPTSQHLANYYGRTEKAFYNKLIGHTGKANYYVSNNHVAKGVDYQSFNYFGVPFYLQTTKTGEAGEDYSNIQYAPSSKSFALTGCMVFSHAYVASALTGRLINPAEMSLLLISWGTMTKGGSSYDQHHKNNMAKLVGNNLKSKYYTASRHSDLMISVTKEMNKGNRMAIIRLGRPYAEGANHYVVLTGAVRMSDGSYRYTMYSSSKVKDAIEYHSLQRLQQSPGNGNRATVFDYEDLLVEPKDDEDE